MGSPEFFFAIAITGVYIAGQLPEARQMSRIKREGHTRVAHTMNIMRGSARSGRSGADVAEDCVASRLWYLRLPHPTPLCILAFAPSARHRGEVAESG